MSKIFKRIIASAMTLTTILSLGVSSFASVDMGQDIEEIVDDRNISQEVYLPVEDEDDRSIGGQITLPIKRDNFMAPSSAQTLTLSTHVVPKSVDAVAQEKFQSFLNQDSAYFLEILESEMLQYKLAHGFTMFDLNTGLARTDTYFYPVLKQNEIVGIIIIGVAANGEMSGGFAIDELSEGLNLLRSVETGTMPIKVFVSEEAYIAVPEDSSQAYLLALASTADANRIATLKAKAIEQNKPENYDDRDIFNGSIQEEVSASNVFQVSVIDEDDRSIHSGYKKLKSTFTIQKQPSGDGKCAAYTLSAVLRYMRGYVTTPSAEWIHTTYIRPTKDYPSDVVKLYGAYKYVAKRYSGLAWSSIEREMTENQPIYSDWYSTEEAHAFAIVACNSNTKGTGQQLYLADTNNPKSKRVEDWKTTQPQSSVSGYYGATYDLTRYYVVTGTK